MLLASTCANIKLWEYCPLGKAQERRKYLWLLVSLWNFRASHGSSMSSWSKAWVLAVCQKESLSTCAVPHQMEDGVRLTCGSHRRRSSGLPMSCSSPRRGHAGFPSRRSESFSNPSTPRPRSSPLCLRLALVSCSCLKRKEDDEKDDTAGGTRSG